MQDAETIDTREKLEEVLECIEPELPAPIEFLGLRLGATHRSSIDINGPAQRAPNPVRVDLGCGELGWPPMIVSVELFFSTTNYRGWLYTVDFCVDDLLTADEVHRKILRAAWILKNKAVATKLECELGADPTDVHPVRSGQFFFH